MEYYAGENHLCATSHWQTVLHKTVHLAMNRVLTLVVIDTDCTGSSKSNYNTIMTTTAPTY